MTIALAGCSEVERENYVPFFSNQEDVWLDDFNIKPVEEAPLDDLPVYDLSGPINAGINTESADIFAADSLTAGSNTTNRTEVIYLSPGHNKEAVKSFDIAVPAGQQWLYGETVTINSAGDTVTLTANNLRIYLQHAYNGYEALKNHNSSDDLTAISTSYIDDLCEGGKMSVVEASMLKLTKDYIIIHPTLTVPDETIIISNLAGDVSPYDQTILEYERNWKLCIYLKSKLESLGYTVNLCRSGLDADGEGTNGEYDRAMAANNARANLLVSVHTGKSLYTTPGTSAVVYKANDLPTESYNCAAQIADKLRTTAGLAMIQGTLPGTAEGWKETILNWANMPAVTVELNLLGRTHDEALLYDGNLSNYADAIAAAIDSYFGYGATN